MGKHGKVTVNNYHMTQHWGVCQEVDTFEAVFYGEKPMWEGSTTNSSIFVQNDNLFGGNGKEGGIKGYIDFMCGGSDQVIPGELAGKYGLITATAPSYRGIASAFFHDADGFAGFKWGANTPYLRDLWFRVYRLPKTALDQTYAIISSAKEVSVNGATVTVNGVSKVLVQSTYTQIGNSLCKIEGTTLTVAGTEINVDAENNEITVGGISEPIYSGLDPSSPSYQKKLKDLIEGVPSGTPAVGMLVNGVLISINYVFHGWYNNDATYYWLSNYTARFLGKGQVNPVHFIFEALTDKVWGMGEPIANFDMDKWNAASQTVYEEGYGIAYKWDQQQSIEDMIGNILAHIEAIVAVRPSTGLIEIRLIRGDYDTTTLPVLDRSNFTLTDFSRKLYTETTNEVVVQYTNDQNEDSASVSIQNSANISIQGNIVSTTKSYTAFRSATVAMKAAQRDLRTVSAPFATLEGDADRTMWDLVPGDVVVVNYPEPGYQMDGLICRVLKVDGGKNGTPQIHINLSEDVFSLPVTAFSSSPSTSWTNPTAVPTPVSDAKVLTPPHWLIDESGEVISDAYEYPQVCSIILTATDNTSITQVNLNGVTTDITGTTTTGYVTNVAPVGVTTLAAALARESSTDAATFGPATGNMAAATGVLLLIGSKGESADEFALITGSTSAGWTLARGLFDTVPRAWPEGTTVWMLTTNSLVFDLSERGAGSLVDYKLTTLTAKGELALADATDIKYTLTDRPYLPLRPANILVAGSTLDTVEITNGSSFDVTWARRNRTTESPVATLWTDGDMAPETDQTTTVELVGSSGNVLKTYSGLTGTSLTVPISDFGDYGQAIVRVSSERNGFASLMSYDVIVNLPGGYGKNYGTNYGT